MTNDNGLLTNLLSVQGTALFSYRDLSWVPDPFASSRKWANPAGPGSARVEDSHVSGADFYANAQHFYVNAAYSYVNAAYSYVNAVHSYVNGAD